MMRSAYNANVPCMLNASTSLNPGRRATIAAHAAFVPCGLVTVLLGPLLPVLASRWKLNDTQSGDLFFALRGAVNDGHAHVAEVFEKGALAAVVANQTNVSPTGPAAQAGSAS